MKELKSKKTLTPSQSEKVSAYDYFDQDSIPFHELQTLFNEAWNNFMLHKMRQGTPQESDMQDFECAHTQLNRFLNAMQGGLVA